MNSNDFDFIKKIIYTHAAITLENGKEYLIESRLLPISRQEGYASISEFIDSVRKNPSKQLYDKIVDAMTTNETLFFRDVHPFEAMRAFILPELIAKRAAQKKLSIWCAASSSGQEPYSLAMLIQEHFPQLRDWHLTFIASDISNTMLERCRQGIYSQFEVNRGLPATYLIKYFKEIAGSWHLDDTICKRIDFHRMNLAGVWPPLPSFDIVLMRNVLLYFDVPTKQNILAKVRKTLAKDGYFFLGGAETTFNLDDRFDRITVGNSVCYQIKQ